MGQGPDPARADQSGSQKRARDHQGGAHLATTTQAAGHHHQPPPQEDPRQKRRQGLEAALLHHRGQGGELHLGAALGSEGGFLLIPQLRGRGPDQHGAPTPEAFGLLQHLPGRHLGQGGGGPAEINPHGLSWQGPPHRFIGQGQGMDPGKIGQGVGDPRPAGDGFGQPPGALEQGRETESRKAAVHRPLQLGLLQPPLLADAVGRRQHHLPAPGSQAPLEGGVIGGTKAAGPGEHHVEHHLPGAPLQHRRGQFGLELPGPGPGAHAPPEGGGAPLRRGEQLIEGEGTGIHRQQHRVQRRRPRAPQLEEHAAPLGIEARESGAQHQRHRQGQAPKRRQSGQRAGGAAGATGAAAGARGESPSSRSITGRVSIGASKPLSSRLLRRRAEASSWLRRRGACQVPCS